MLNEHITHSHEVFNCDCEKAEINAILKPWKDCKIGGCFFHYSHNLFKHLGKSKILKILPVNQRFM